MQGAKEFPYKSMHKYPGMRPKDVAIWDEFIITHPGIFVRVWYNVKVGDPSGGVYDPDEIQANGYHGVTSWAIDVVGDDGQNFYTVEVKPNAMGGAIGQALCYSKLLGRYADLQRPIKPVVLTDDIAPITLEAASLVGVSILTP